LVQASLVGRPITHFRRGVGALRGAPRIPPAPVLLTHLQQLVVCLCICVCNQYIVMFFVFIVFKEFSVMVFCLKFDLPNVSYTPVCANFCGFVGYYEMPTGLWVATSAYGFCALRRQFLLCYGREWFHLSVRIVSIHNRCILYRFGYFLQFFRQNWTVGALPCTYLNNFVLILLLLLVLRKRKLVYCA
jgi:hypothetical protein